MHPKDRAQMMAYLTRPGMAKGGRIGFFKGELVKIGPQKGKIRVQNIGKKLPGGSRAAKFFNVCVFSAACFFLLLTHQN